MRCVMSLHLDQILTSTYFLRMESWSWYTDTFSIWLVVFIYARQTVGWQLALHNFFSFEKLCDRNMHANLWQSWQLALRNFFSFEKLCDRNMHANLWQSCMIEKHACVTQWSVATLGTQLKQDGNILDQVSL